MMPSSQQRTRSMPPPKGFVRKILGVPPELAEAVKEFRFEHRLENDGEAYRVLIKKGLEAFEREEQGKERRRPKP
jgi:hypothetical protein